MLESLILIVLIGLFVMFIDKIGCLVLIVWEALRDTLRRKGG